MGKILSKEDEELRPHLIEYNRADPSPQFSRELIDYIESIQEGFSEAELAWLRENEYFILNTHINGLIAHEIPGLRKQQCVETCYVRRFNSDVYRHMINTLLDQVPPDFPIDQVGQCNLPGYRLTLADGGQFYPLNYHGDLVAWRKRLSESAKLHGTMTGQFQHGKFVLSDGRRINFFDLAIASLFAKDPYPSDW